MMQSQKKNYHQPARPHGRQVGNFMSRTKIGVIAVLISGILWCLVSCEQQMVFVSSTSIPVVNIPNPAPRPGAVPISDRSTPLPRNGEEVFLWQEQNRIVNSDTEGSIAKQERENTYELDGDDLPSGVMPLICLDGKGKAYSAGWRLSRNGINYRCANLGNINGESVYFWVID